MKTVEKVWGREDWIVNRGYCGKFLYLNEGYQCSLHYHERKDETFLVLKGHVRLESGDGVLDLKSGDIVTIEPGTKHRFAGLEDSLILEISTHDDDDNVRLEPSGEME